MSGGMTDVDADAVALPIELAVIVAVFVRVVTAFGAVTTIEIGGAAATASSGIVQVTVPDDCEQVQPVPVALTNVVPAGRGSGTTTSVASSGPVFETVMV